jgi:hypothetical protein
MNETLGCSACGRALHVPDDLRGQSVKCPACHHVFTAPDSGDTAPPQVLAPPREEPPPGRAASSNGSNRFDDRPHFPVEVDEEYEDAPPYHGQGEKPGKVQAIAIMTLVGGIFAVLVGLFWVLTCVGLLIPTTYYSFVVGIMAIIKGASLLGDGAYRQTPPKAIAIMQIVNILAGDVVNLGLGIATLVLLGDTEVKAYLRRR